MIRSAATSDALRLNKILLLSEKAASGACLKDLYRRQRNELTTVLRTDHASRTFIYVCEDEGIVKGMVAWTTFSATCKHSLTDQNCWLNNSLTECVEIRGLYVDPEWRCQGIGRRMITSFLRNMEHQNISTACIWILADDVATARFCEEFDFVKTASSRISANGNRVVRWTHSFF